MEGFEYDQEDLELNSESYRKPMCSLHLVIAKSLAAAFWTTWSRAIADSFKQENMELQ